MKNNKLRAGLLSALLFLFSSALLNAQIKVEAENFSEQMHLSSEIITENDGKTVGYFDEKGEKLVYEIDFPEDGLYQVSFKYLTGKAGSIKIEDAEGHYSIFQTEANYAEKWWDVALNNWPEYPISKSAHFPIKSGKQKITVTNTGTSINIDYFVFTKTSSTDSEIIKINSSPSKLSLMPNETTSILAYGYNAAGELIASQTIWSDNAKEGEYTAGSAEGSDVVRITIGNISKEVKVKILMPTKEQEFVVTKNGQLQIKNGSVCNKNGEKLSLMGPSFFWSCSAPLWWKAETVDYLVSQYNVQLIRLPVSIAPGDNTWNNPDATWNEDNYLHRPEYTKILVDNMVRAAIENDIYVIIDFHEHNAEHWTDLAKDFFTYFATKWGNYPNVMYEIYNEPTIDNGTVVAYAKEVIPVIRNIDKNNIIIVGSTQYSREPDNVTAAGNGYSNIAYTWHGYVEWGHQSDWNGKASWNNGVPIVVTEWGLNWSKNDGGLINLYKEKKVINAFWSMSNKGGDDSKWSILKENCYKTTDWTESEMTENGAYLLGVAKDWVNYKPVILNIPTELALSISADQTFFLPKSETTLSSDATGGSENYKYTWTQISGPSMATIASVNIATTTVSNLTSGTYLFQLTVSDGEDEVEKSIKLTIFPEGYVDPGLIDNLEDNDIISLWGGKWKSFDDSDKNASPYSQTTSSENLAKNGVLNIDFTMGKQWNGDGWMGDPYCGVDLFLKADEMAYDLSDCSQITYRFKGAAHEFRVAMAAVIDDDFHYVKINASTDWTDVTISWESLRQATDWGVDMELDKSDIYKLSWQLKEQVGTKGNLQIDDVVCKGSFAPTSIEEVNSMDKHLSIAPNPAAVGGLTSLYVSACCEVTISDITGSIVMKFNAIPNFDNKINIQKKGIYIVKVGSKAQKLIVR